MLRSREEYVARLLKMRPNLYIGGEKVGRDDHRIQPGINTLGVTFELAKDPAYRDVMTVTSSITGEEINRFAHLPQNPHDLLQKQKMIRIYARRVGGCIQRCMGHDALTALSICTKEMDEEYGTEYHGRFLQYLKWYHENDIDATCSQTDCKGDRLKRPSEQENPDAYVHVVEKRQDGIVVSGTKMCITQAAYADELLVLPTRALMEDDSDYAVAFALPADWEGIRRTSSGTFFPNEIYANVGRRMTGEMIYHEYNILTEVAGGISVTLPFGEDFDGEETRADLEKFIVRNSKISAEESLKIWKFVEAVGASAMTSWYLIAGVHGGGSPVMETIALNLGFDYGQRRDVARYLAGIEDDLDDSKLLNMNPAFGDRLK